MSDSKWFSKAGNLDDSIDDRTASVESTRTESVPTIKPVKGLKDRTVTSVKEEHRCSMCGAIIPQGTTLCWKCSSESDIGNKNVRNTGHSLALLWRRYKMPLVFGGVACLILVITLVLSLWGSRSNTPNLEDLILTDDILTYQLDDGTIKTSQLDEFEVLSSRTIDDHDSSDVRVVLSDDMIERTLFISAESTKYDQGWLIDSITVTDSSFRLIGDIDQDYVRSNLSNDIREVDLWDTYISYDDQYVVKAGLHNVTILNTEIQDNTYLLDCTVDDIHQYAEIYGTFYVQIDVYMTVDNNTGACIVTRRVRPDTDSLTTNWHGIYGTYLRTDSDNNLEEYITIEETNSVYGYGDYIEFGQQRHNIIDDATYTAFNYSTVLIHFYSVNGYSTIVITPDEINYYTWRGGTFDYVKVDTFERIDPVNTETESGVAESNGATDDSSLNVENDVVSDGYYFSALINQPDYLFYISSISFEGDYNVVIDGVFEYSVNSDTNYEDSIQGPFTFVCNDSTTYYYQEGVDENFEPYVEYVSREQFSNDVSEYFYGSGLGIYIVVQNGIVVSMGLSS